MSKYTPNTPLNTPSPEYILILQIAVLPEYILILQIAVLPEYILILQMSLSRLVLKQSRYHIRTIPSTSKSMLFHRESGVFQREKGVSYFLKGGFQKQPHRGYSGCFSCFGLFWVSVGYVGLWLASSRLLLGY